MWTQVQFRQAVRLTYCLRASLSEFQLNQCALFSSHEGEQMTTKP
jgi:hypothetical protein